ncbi:MAG: hypothetical protein KGJ60_12195 [Verrucomicrobiota bacterium]|nr:hypothetical protein [Verrucomicrobiota bacterium]
MSVEQNPKNLSTVFSLILVVKFLLRYVICGPVVLKMGIFGMIRLHERSVIFQRGALFLVGSGLAELLARPPGALPSFRRQPWRDAGKG